MNDSVPETFDPSLPTAVVAFRSWRSMKTWVMAWLWYLNVVYWGAFLFLDRPEAWWALAAYLAVGPFIVAMVRTQRGLTRLSGLIHLPWVPFAVYLGLRLFTGTLGAPVAAADSALYYGWLQILFWSTIICLGFDAVDVARWLRGERYVIGTPAAYAAGASRDARYLAG